MTPQFPDVAVLVGKGPSLDHADWDDLREKTDCFVWINESYLIGVELGLPITAAIAQDGEALQMYSDPLAGPPDDTIILTQKGQHHRGNCARFEFRDPWYEFDDIQPGAELATSYVCASNAVCVMASAGVNTIYFVGFDGLRDWDKTDEPDQVYANAVLDLGIEWSARTAPKPWRLYRKIGKQIIRAIHATGIDAVIV